MFPTGIKFGSQYFPQKPELIQSYWKQNVTLAIKRTHRVAQHNTANCVQVLERDHLWVIPCPEATRNFQKPGYR